MFCSNGCTLLGMLGGGLIDESKQYTIESPTYEDLNLDLGTPVSLALISEETINGRFTKSYILHDSLGADIASANNIYTDTLNSPLPDSNSATLVIYLPTHDNHMEVPINQIREIEVKPHTNAIYMTAGLGLFIDLMIILNWDFN